MKAKLLVGLAGALALAACGQDDDAEQSVDSEATDLAAPAADAQPDPGTPQGFVDLAASSDMYEIEAGRLAQEMGTSADVKEFGEMMVMDHTASSSKLKAAVDTEPAGLSVPPSMLPRHQQQLDALRSAGDQFDTLYAQQQVAAHQEALTLLRQQAETGTVASLKAFAAETALIVEGHLGRARELP